MSRSPLTLVLGLWEARRLTLTLAYAARAFHSGPRTLLDEHAGRWTHCYWPPGSCDSWALNTAVSGRCAFQLASGSNYCRSRPSNLAWTQCIRTLSLECASAVYSATRTVSIWLLLRPKTSHSGWANVGRGAYSPVSGQGRCGPGWVRRTSLSTFLHPRRPAQLNHHPVSRRARAACGGAFRACVCPGRPIH